ncbi:MAG: FkbM family methyltransferase [Verrucomicrobium sp.]|nr:FkbM family methyltransferase [Verrucomicrobium sp.]
MSLASLPPQHPLALLADALGANDGGAKLRGLLDREWAERFGRPDLIGFNRLLVDLGMRGLGILNYQDDAINGLEWFLKAWAVNAGAPAPTVVDVGGNEGDFVQVVLRARPDARLFSYEPAPRSFAKLQEVAAGRQNVTIRNIALGDQPGRLPLYDYDPSCNEKSTAHASLFPEVFSVHWKKPVTAVEVEIRTLDTVCAEEGIEHIDLLKIDTEGAELKVLQGAARLIAENRIKVVHFEFNRMNVIARSFFQDFAALLPRHSFGRLLPQGILALDPGDLFSTNFFEFQNLVALPKEPAA